MRASPGKTECPKCGEDFTKREPYVRFAACIGHISGGVLVWRCARCDFEWETPTKDAQKPEGPTNDVIEEGRPPKF